LALLCDYRYDVKCRKLTKRRYVWDFEPYQVERQVFKIGKWNYIQGDWIRVDNLKKFFDHKAEVKRNYGKSPDEVMDKVVLP